MVAKAKAGEKSSDNAASFKFGVSYLSNNVFMGRADTVTTPMIVPELKYTFKNGIYASGTLDYIPKKPTNKLDGGDVTGGYEFDINDNLSGSASLAKLFYSSSSTQIAAAIRATANANFTYDFGDIISVTVSSDYNFNKQGINNDIFLNGGLSHDFIKEGIFGLKDIFLISPTASINAGTQNFYDAYLVLTKKLRTARRTAALNAIIAQYTNQLSQFEILDYEFSAPLEYKAGHFIFPVYANLCHSRKPVAEKLLKPAYQARVRYFILKQVCF